MSENLAWFLPDDSLLAAELMSPLPWPAMIAERIKAESALREAAIVKFMADHPEVALADIYLREQQGYPYPTFEVRARTRDEKWADWLSDNH